MGSIAIYRLLTSIDKKVDQIMSGLTDLQAAFAAESVAQSLNQTAATLNAAVSPPAVGPAVKAP